MVRRAAAALFVVAACSGLNVAAPTTGPHTVRAADGAPTSGPPHCCR